MVVPIFTPRRSRVPSFIRASEYKYRLSIRGVKGWGVRYILDYARGTLSQGAGRGTKQRSLLANF